MTGNYNSQRFDKEHRHFGGLIYQSDFNTDYRGKNNTNGSTIASRIESDMRWEQKLYEDYQRERKNRNTYGQH